MAEIRDPEQIVIAWIGQEGHPPLHLSQVLAQYRDLVAYADLESTSVAAANVAVEKANVLFDRLLAAATVTLEISAKAEAQLRRIHRKEEAHMTLTQKWDRAINQWRAGVRV